MNVLNAKRAATFLTFLLGIKNQKLCLVVMARIALSKRRVLTTKTENSPFLEEFLRESESSTPESEPQKAKIIAFMA